MGPSQSGWLGGVNHAGDVVPLDAPGSLKGLVLETQDLEGTIAEFASRGFVLEGGIDEQPWGRVVSFDDPDGNGIVLRAPPRRTP